MKNLVISALILTVASGCAQKDAHQKSENSLNSSNTNHEDRYKITMTVDTPVGLRSGSSVVRLVQQNVRSITQGEMVIGGFTGEAVSVDLPDSLTVYMTFYKRHIVQYQMALPWDANAKKLWEKNPSGSFDIPEDEWPILVVFRDPSNYKTVTEVDPKNPKMTLGNGYKIRSISIKKTTDEPSEELYKHLPWVKNWGGNMNGKHSRSTNDIPDILDTGAFTMGFYKY